MNELPPQSFGERVDSTVKIGSDGSVAVLTLDNPPVNAIGSVLRRDLYAALQKVDSQADIDGVVLTCAGRTFVAGADIAEFGTPKQTQPPSLPEICEFIEAMQKPVVAAIHGTALGGGLELALACHFRVVDKRVKLGLPEVQLGMMPGSGGTVRLPRLVGPEKALEMIVSGQPIGAEDAMKSGLADVIACEDRLADAVSLARQYGPQAGTTIVKVRDRDEKLRATRANPSQFEALASAKAVKARGRAGLLACIQAVRDAITLPFDEALAKERAVFLQLAASEEAKAMRHLFFAERAATNVPGVDNNAAARTVSKIGVIGAGTMGGGIAMAFANAGYPVLLVDAADEPLQRGLGWIRNNYSVSVTRGSLSGLDVEDRLSRISGTTSFDALNDCDLIIEAVFEDMAVKRDVFSRLGSIAKPSAILATNTSYLDVDEIAQASGRPKDVVGLHFFSPANVMKLLEIVRGRDTEAGVLATSIAVARKIGKVPVVVGVCHGFVGNRMLAARAAENEYLLLEGATPADIDKAFIDFGWPMGPFQMGDLAGLDIGWRSRKALGRKAILADALCEVGHFGQKTGRGWYLYDSGSRKPHPDPHVENLIAETATGLGIVRRTISSEEIIERTHYPMIAEGLKILEEGIASRASDIDLVWVHGYGFPAGKGGPMHWAHATLSSSEFGKRLEYWRERTGRSTFDPAPLNWF